MYDFLAFALPLMGKNFLHVLPLILVTVPLAQWLKRSGLSSRFVPALRSRPMMAILLATIAGAFSPLCSCGVIPVIAGFLSAGMPLGPVMAFWIASPSMDPEIFVLSAGVLGLPLAIGRLAATTLLSLAAGFGAHYLEKKGIFGAEGLRIPGGNREVANADSGGLKVAGSCCAAAGPTLSPQSPRGAQALKTCSCSLPQTRDCSPADSGNGKSIPAGEPEGETGSRSRLVGIAVDSLKELPSLMAIMLLAFFLETVIVKFLPANLVSSVAGSESRLGVLFAAAIGVPLYVTNLAALGIVRGLLESGMSGGAALAFLVGGAATTIPAMTAVWVLVKPRIFVYYVATIFAGALVAGYGWNILAAVINLR